MPTELFTPTCPACGYSLAGLPKGACPECGRHFDPAERIASHFQSTLYSKASITPPRLLIAAYALVVVPIFLVVCGPNAEMSDPCAIRLGLITMVTAAGWGLLFLLHLFARLALVTQRAKQPPWRWRWLAIPAIFLACLGSLRSCLVWNLRWSLARSSFNAAIVAPGGPPTSGWIGTFTYSKCERKPDGSTWFTLGFPDWYSEDPLLIYSPQGPPTSLGFPFCADVGGGWWVELDPT